MPNQPPSRKPYTKAFGDRVRTLRQSKTKLSQEALSAKIGVHRTFISRVERGETNITLVNIVRICAILEVSLSEFFVVFEEKYDIATVLQNDGEV